MGKGKGPCEGCGKMGHTAERCWTLHPDQLPWKGANAVDNWGFEYDYYGDQGGVHCGVREGLDVGSLEKRIFTPPRLTIHNMFGELGTKEDDKEMAEVDVGGLEVCGLDVVVPGTDVNVVKKAIKTKKGEKLTSAGKQWITLDSRAGESAMPKDMVPNERLIDGDAKKAGVKYVAANGGTMENYGEKRVRFMRKGATSVDAITFQVTDVSKPLAAISRLLDKGNTVVLSRRPGGSYVENDFTKERFEVQERGGTFGIDVEMFEPMADVSAIVPNALAPGFTRPGR